MERFFNRLLAAAVVAVCAILLHACGDNDKTVPELPVDMSGNFYYPFGITSDGTDLYVTDTGNSTLRQIKSVGTISTIAGTAGYSGAVDGSGSAARFNQTRYLVWNSGALFIAGGSDRAIRKVVSGTVSTIAGLLGTAGADVSQDADTNGTNARFTEPSGIALLGDYLYILDGGAGTPFLRAVDTVTAPGKTLALQLAPATLGDKTIVSYLAGSYGLATDGADLYLTNTDASTVLKGVIDNLTSPTSVTFTIFAGASNLHGSADAPSGPATDARFYNPTGITYGGTALYVTDTGNSTIRKIDIPSGAVTTLAGSAGTTGTTNGFGSLARFNYPFGLTLVGADLYVADTLNHTIRKLDISTGEVTTLVGKPGVRGSNDAP